MIVLLRHGKTMANEQKLYAGAWDLPLSETGRQELLTAEKQGIYPAGDVFFTSGMLRCEETLNLFYGKVERTHLSDLAEFRFGSFEGKSYEMLRENPAYLTWIADTTGQVACPGGESKASFQARVERGFRALQPWLLAKDTAIAILHGGVIATLMERLFPNQMNFYEWQPSTGQGWAVTATGYKKIGIGKDGGALPHTPTEE